MPQLQAFPLFFSEQANIFVSSCCQFFFSHTEKLQWFMMTFCASCFPKFSRGRQPFSNATLRQIQRQACSWAPPHQRSTSSRRCTNVFAPVSLGCKRRASRAAHAPPQCDGGRQRACACAPARRHTTRPFGARRGKAPYRIRCGGRARLEDGRGWRIESDRLDGILDIGRPCVLGEAVSTDRTPVPRAGMGGSSPAG